MGLFVRQAKKGGKFIVLKAGDHEIFFEHGFTTFPSEASEADPNFQYSDLEYRMVSNFPVSLRTENSSAVGELSWSNL